MNFQLTGVRRWSPCCLVTFAMISLISGRAVGVEPPNLVFIIADDCTHRDIGCYGGQAQTPHIDRLATEGLRMTQCFQAAPMCSPTRHTIYTGLYPVKSGAYPNHTFVKEDVRSVVHYLKPLGYRIALSGKTHIGPRENFPFEYSGKNNPDMGAIDTLMRESAASKTPFCLFACSNEPHTPHNKGDASQYPPEDVVLPPYYVDSPDLRQQFSRYLAEITYYDGQVGEILSLLDQHKLADNTLVMVVSEQGNSFPFAKWTCYDHGLQSAMVIRWPGHVQPATTSDALVEYVDILPTFIEAAGGTPPDVLDGKSLLPVLSGQSDTHKDYVYGIQTSRGIFGGPDYYGRRSIRSKDFKLIHNLTPDARFFNGIANETYFKDWEAKAAAGDERARELVERYYSPPEWELFDLQADPLEQHNLAHDPNHAAVRGELQRQLAAWMTSQGDLGQETEMNALERMNGGNARLRNAGQPKPRDASPAPSPAAVPRPRAIRRGLRSHDQALYIKTGWIRDPYIVLGPDDHYYLTGTTPLPDDPRQESDPYNTGLGDESIVGWRMQVWRSADLVDWQSLGTPFSLKDGIWPKARPARFQEVPEAQWRLWAPELHDVGGRWAIIHTSPSPVRGANLCLTQGLEIEGPFENPLGEKIDRRHDPSLFRNDDGTWWMIWGATQVAPLLPDFSDFAAEPTTIGPSGETAKMGHEGCLIHKIGNTYVLFGTGWSTGQMRKGSYNLYYATADKLTGPYSERKFAGRFLGHGTPFQDREGRWWCTAFYNGNIPPLTAAKARSKDLSETAQTINQQGVTIVPLDVRRLEDGDVHIRAIDPDYATPGPDEAQQFSLD